MADDKSVAQTWNGDGLFLGSAEAMTINVPNEPMAVSWQRAAQTVLTVSVSGEVAINWGLVDEWLAKPEQHDTMARASLQAIVAVRDGTWKPLKPQ